MAGVLVPTWFLLLALAGFIAVRIIYRISTPVEQLIVFPMAVVPNLWGLWNTLYVAMSMKHRLGLGAWGALMPAILVPAGLGLEKLLGFSLFTPMEGFAALPVIAAVYYLIWKHLVSFLNRTVGVS
jgi:hypothetical protein